MSERFIQGQATVATGNSQQQAYRLHYSNAKFSAIDYWMNKSKSVTRILDDQIFNAGIVQYCDLLNVQECAINSSVLRLLFSFQCETGSVQSALISQGNLRLNIMLCMAFFVLYEQVEVQVFRTSTVSSVISTTTSVVCIQKDSRRHFPSYKFLTLTM